jgi:hypothetical protein
METKLIPGAVFAAIILASTVGGAAFPTGDVSTLATNADTNDIETGHDHDERIDRIVNRLQTRYNLTDEQAAILDQHIETQYDNGAARGEIKRRVAKQLVEWGIDPITLRRDAARLKPHQLEQRYDLNDSQTGTIVEVVKEQRSQDASRAEIKSAVKAQLAAWDVFPEPPRLVQWFGNDLELTDEQVTELAELVEDKRDAGALRPEIRRAVVDRLHEYGITTAEIVDSYVDAHVYRIAQRHDLRAHQTADLDDLVEEMRDDGASRDEIRAAVRSQLEDRNAHESS